jgi:uncharacterized protein (DUF2062 family)
MTMLHLLLNRRPWFAARRYGFGSGLPIRWQGWAFMVAHIALVAGLAKALAPNPVIAAIAVIVAVIAPLPIYAARTDGGWRWRWGE